MEAFRPWTENIPRINGEIMDLFGRTAKETWAMQADLVRDVFSDYEETTRRIVGYLAEPSVPRAGDRSVRTGRHK
jgi:hypothetical protein